MITAKISRTVMNVDFPRRRESSRKHCLKSAISKSNQQMAIQHGKNSGRNLSHK